MSLTKIIDAIEKERSSSFELERSLIDRIDGQIAALETLKEGIREEIQEREKALLRIILGDGKPDAPEP